MAGLSPKIPLMPDSIDGFYALNKTIKQVVKQNLKHLLLTIPGERLMIPNFGVGLERYLFEPYSVILEADIEARIRNQVDQFMPHVKIENINFSSPTPEGEASMHTHRLFVGVKYSVPALSIQSLLKLTVTSTTSY